MGLPDHAKAKPVSSLLAFFEQQQGTTTAPSRGKGGSTAGNGKIRVRSNFVPVARTANSTPPDTVEPANKSEPAENLPAPRDSKPEKPNGLEAPAVQNTGGAAEKPKRSSTDADQMSTEVKINGSSKNPPAAPAPKVTREKDSALQTNALPVPKEIEAPTASLPLQPTTQNIVPPSPPKSVTTSKKAIPLPSPKTPPAAKRAPYSSTAPKSPPTPTKAPTPSKSSPIQKKTLGPLSPTKSISSRRSSSPFLVSPVGPPKVQGSPSANKSVKPSKSPAARRESTPKAAAKPSPRTSLPSAPKPAVKVSPAPTKTKPFTTPPSQPNARPISALSNLSTPPTSRRTVSHSPRPSISTSNKSSPRLSRSASLHNLPKSKPISSDQPPVPPIPQAKRTSNPEDYSHLPAFMRPTQASSGKIVARPVSSMEKRRGDGSFKI